MLRIAGEQVVSEWPSRGVSPSIELLEAAGGTLLRMSDGGETRDLLWRDIGPDRALLLMAGADMMLLARRRGPVPRAIQGEWVVTAPDGDPVRRMEFASNSVQMLTVSGEQREGEAAGLGVEGPGRFAFMLAVDSPMGRAPGSSSCRRSSPTCTRCFRSARSATTRSSIVRGLALLGWAARCAESGSGDGRG